MTGHEKIAVSIPTHLVAKARRAVKQGEAPSVSAYIARAVEQKAMQDDLDAMLDEWLAETGGPPTSAERRRAREKLAAVLKRRDRSTSR
jgi:Arc/MetJ-type ribon-helix-helix transcriptional regulator